MKQCPSCFTAVDPNEIVDSVAKKRPPECAQCRDLFDLVAEVWPIIRTANDEQNRIRGWKAIAVACVSSERNVREWAEFGYFRDGMNLLPVRSDWLGYYVDRHALRLWMTNTDNTFQGTSAIKRGRRKAPKKKRRTSSRICSPSESTAA